MDLHGAGETSSEKTRKQQRGESEIRAIALSTAGLFLGLWLGVVGTEPAHALIAVSVSADQDSYVLGEPITFFVTATNPSREPVQLVFPTTLQAQYTLDGVYTPRILGGDAITTVTLSGTGRHTWEFHHWWDYFPFDVGSHSVGGTVVGYGASGGLNLFEVTAPRPVTEDVFIDFEHYPDGTPSRDENDKLTFGRGMWRDAYAAWGVRFDSIDGSVNMVAQNGNTHLHTPTTSYPPGFNIMAEFDMPVFGVSAEVSSAAGQTVTMVALDEGGQVIDSVTSAAVPSYLDFVGPLELYSTTPIATVRWWPSTQNASVQIDDLNLAVGTAVGTAVGIPVPEPTSLVLAVMALVGFAWRARRSRAVLPSASARAAQPSRDLGRVGR